MDVVQRVREILAHGEIALLAIVFALALATVSLATSLAQEVVSSLQQAVYNPETGSGALEFTVLGTTVSYAYVLQAAVATCLLGVALWGVWRLTKRERRTCPECLSEVPGSASICRYCTTELSPAEIT